MSRYWVLEKLGNEEFTQYYAGDLKFTHNIEEAFRYGWRGLAEQFKKVVPTLADFAAVEYEITYTKVGR
jgi:hypothetical protein